MEVRYPSQRLAYPFFVIMGILFLAQVSYGLLLAVQHIDPYLLRGILNFNVARSTHLNLAVLWIMSGLLGTAIFITPLLAGRDLVSPLLARLLAVAVAAVTLWNWGTLGLAQRGVAGWAAGQPWLQEGLEYIEGGRVTDLLLLAGFTGFAWLMIRTFPPVRRWNELHWGLATGLTGLAVVWIFGMLFVPRIDLQEYLRWYVVHYWVEGVWEIIHITLIGFLLWTLYGADIKAIGYAVFWGVVLVALSGLIGNAHHYFWIGTPEFWQFWGSLFSALEPLPMIFCLWHLYVDASHGDRPPANLTALYFIVGSAVYEHVGAGLLGFTQTFALTNYWEHGTWVTPAHGHMALFGTFGMLAVAGAYSAIPAIRNAVNYDQRLGKLSFWLLFTGLLGISLSFAFGGTVQVYVYRILGLDWWGGEVRPAMAFWKASLLFFGTVFFTGASIAVYDLLTIGRRVVAASGMAHAHGLPHHAPAAPGGVPRSWRPLGHFEFGSWIAMLWLFGLVITGGLLTYNLDSVRLGDPTAPYVLSGVGYTGLAAVTFLFVRRFIQAVEQAQVIPPDLVPARAPARGAVAAGADGV